MAPVSVVLLSTFAAIYAVRAEVECPTYYQPHRIDKSLCLRIFSKGAMGMDYETASKECEAITDGYVLSGDQSDKILTSHFVGSWNPKLNLPFLQSLDAWLSRKDSTCYVVQIVDGKPTVKQLPCSDKVESIVCVSASRHDPGGVTRVHGKTPVIIPLLTVACVLLNHLV